MDLFYRWSLGYIDLCTNKEAIVVFEWYGKLTPLELKHTTSLEF